MSTRDRNIILLLGFAAVAYVNARAALLAFTYDECWSFMGYARRDWWDVFTNADPSSNNHILNSLLMRMGYLGFGQVEYALRLPSLLAHLGYVIITYQIVRRYFPKLAVFAFLILNFQPYLLDYFVAARGYGLAIFFTVFALYRLLSFHKSLKSRDLAIAIFATILATLANFTYALIFISVVTIAFVSSFRLNMKIRIWAWIKIAFSASLFFPLIVSSLSKINKAGEIYYGGDKGFFSDTLHSLGKQMLYGNHFAEWGIWLFPTLLIVFAFLGLWALWKLFKKGFSTQFATLGCSIALLLMPAIGSVLLHIIFGKPYLMDRTAIFLVPLSLVVLLFTIKYFTGEGKRLIINVGLFGTLAFTISVFVSSINFSYLIDFKEHADTRQALLNLQKIQQRDPKPYFTLGKSTYMNATINFYKVKYELPFMTYADLTFCNDNGPYPYYYVHGIDKDCTNDLNVELIQYYPVSDTYLFKNKDFN